MTHVQDLAREIVAEAIAHECQAEAVAARSVGLQPNVCLVRINGTLYNVLDAQAVFRPAPDAPAYVRFSLSRGVMEAVDGTICRDSVNRAAMRHFIFETELRDAVFPPLSKTERSIYPIPLIRNGHNNWRRPLLDPWPFLEAWPTEKKETPRK